LKPILPVFKKTGRNRNCKWVCIFLGTGIGQDSDSLRFSRFRIGQ
jgi:hypothetical protein